MQINTAGPIANKPATGPRLHAAASSGAAQRPAFAGDSRIKARGADAPGSDEDKLASFIAANKGANPGLDKAAENLSLAGHLKADAVLLVLGGLVGAGAREVITRFTNKDTVFADMKAQSTDPTDRWVVASKMPLDIKTAMFLAADPDLSVRYALAIRMKNNPHQFDKAVLETMANDPNPLIRSMVASSDKLKKETVARLADSTQEPSPQVRMAALSNPNMDKAAKEFAIARDGAAGGVVGAMEKILGAKGDDTTKLNFLRDNPTVGLSRKMMETLAASDDVGVREALARRPDVPDAVLNQIFEHRSMSASQKMKFFGDPGLPAGSPNFETSRAVLMAIANNPNVSPATLTNMVTRINRDAQKNSGIKSKIEPRLDQALGIPTTDLDPNALNTDIVARAIVGNPKTDPTIRMLANDKSPVPVDPTVAKQAFMAINRANDLFLNGKYSEAADQYKAAIGTTFHDNENAYYELAQCLLRMQQPDNARRALMQSLNINVSYTPAANLLNRLNQGGGSR